MFQVDEEEYFQTLPDNTTLMLLFKVTLLLIMFQVDEEEYFQTLPDNTTLILLFKDNFFVDYD